MRTTVSYISGVLVGLGLALGVGRLLPVLIGADRPLDTPQQSVSSVSAVSAQSYIEPIRQGRETAITVATRKVAPAVVGINVISVREYRVRNPFFDDPFFRQFFPDQVYREKVENLGSGFIITSDGYILTNEHVVHEASEIVVTTTDDRKYDAEVVGFDYDMDVALLKIDGKDLPFIRFGDSDSVIIGEWAIALGNPFGLFAIHSQPSVTVGVISATDRDFERNNDGRLYQDMIQTDASINRGNSGGPLVNALGELIGMNTMIFTESGGSIGLGFAIPSNRLKKLYEELRTRGEIDRDFTIGLSIQSVNRLVAMSLKLPEVRGAVVTDVEAGSPAAQAGFEVPDVILAINGQNVNDAADVARILRNSDLRVGDKVRFTVFREGRKLEITVRLGKRPR